MPTRSLALRPPPSAPLSVTVSAPLSPLLPRGASTKQLNPKPQNTKP